MTVEGGPDIVNNGLSLVLDASNLRSYPGDATTNLVSSATAMSSWSWYYRTTAATTFTTEFGTTGYRFVNQPSWNGIVRTFNLGSAGTYTFSAWFRYWGGSSNNNGATVYISNYGAGDTAAGLDKSKVGEWQRISITVSVTSPSNVYFYIISYGGTDNGTGNPDYSSWDVTMPQIEAGSSLTPFVDGTRSGNWLDISGNSNSFTPEGTVRYSSISNGTLQLNAGRIYRNTLGWYGNYTISFWVKMMSVLGGNFYTESDRVGSGCARIYSTMNSNGTFTYAGWDNSSGGSRSVTTTTNVQDGNWYQICCIWSNGSSNRTRGMYVFVNGVQEAYQDMVGNDGGYASMHLGGSFGCVGTSTSNCYLGQVLQYNNVALTDNSILQNYNALRRRYQ